jgi:Restriction endonuclease
MHDPRVIIDEITRASVDGGRDAVGRYLLGLSDDPVYAEFSLEAKCYAPGIRGMNANNVGVKEVSRLISHIRHRQFGVLVTTSTIGRQAYEEVREDRHPSGQSGSTRKRCTQS